jgi:hypothetical protein
VTQYLATASQELRKIAAYLPTGGKKDFDVPSPDCLQQTEGFMEQEQWQTKEKKKCR